MSKLLSYKNYNGTVEYSSDDEYLFGRVIGIKSLISYKGNSVKELKKDFENAVDQYLKNCNEKGIIPEVPYKGSFNIRISPELHRSIALYAIERGKSLNSAVEEAISNIVQTM